MRAMPTTINRIRAKIFRIDVKYSNHPKTVFGRLNMINIIIRKIVTID